MPDRRRPAPDDRGAERARTGRRLADQEDRRRSLLAVIGVTVAVAVGLVLLLGLQVVGQAFAPVRTESAIYTEKVAVVGVVDRTAPTDTDLAVFDTGPTQVGAVLTGGDCAASGWASLSAARPVQVACRYEVTDLGVIDDWRDRQAEAARTGGELGTLADAGANCVTAVGPGAALGAAHGDGTNADYRSVDDFVGSDFADYCPVTLIDAGERSDEVISALAARDDWTVMVVGIGGDADAQLIYRTRTTFPGWLGSASTERQGVVTLADVSQTLQGLVAGSPPPVGPVGHPLQVEENSGVAPDRLGDHLDRTDRLVRTPVTPMIIIGAVVALGLIGAAIARRLGRADGDWLGFGAATLPTGLLAAGVVGWWRTSNPDTTLVASVLLCWVGACVGARAVARRIAPGSVGVAALVVAVPTLAGLLIDAALGGGAQRSSLLALRPMRDFDGFDGPAWALLLAAGAVVVGALLHPWWQDRSARADGSATPYRRFARPVFAVGVVVATLLACSWTVPSASEGVAQQWLSGLAVLGWVAASGWLLRRSVDAGHRPEVG